MDKVGRYEYVAESFHCDFTHRLFMGHLGNHLLNAADCHSAARGFGMPKLTPIRKTWVLARLVIEMTEMPQQYSHFVVETWIESVMRLFTNRNFRISDGETGRTLGYGRSVWALIDTDTRQPQDITEAADGAIMPWVVADRQCPIGTPSRVKVSSGAELVSVVSVKYSDIDVNGHVNSVKYIEHVLDLFDTDWFAGRDLQRIDIAYVAESRYGDRLALYEEQTGDGSRNISITKQTADGDEAEVCRCRVIFNTSTN